MKMKINSAIFRTTILFILVFVSHRVLSGWLITDLPTLYIIGDSTVKNGSGKGSDKLWGWGSVIDEHFDTTKIHIENHAIGGRSSRTFITDGRWDKIMAKLKKGDYVMMQFGHNDVSAVNDSTRARGTIAGTGDETQEIDNILTKKHETVHSYGWYMKKYISDAKSKGAIPIVCTLVPRCGFKDGKTVRSNNSYAKWAIEVAETEKAFLIDLNEAISLKYDAMGEKAVKEQFFPNDNTHTNLDGAKLNAQIVVEGLKGLKKCKLRKALK